MHFLQLQHRSRQEKPDLPPVVHAGRPVNWATIQAMKQGRDYLEYVIDGRALSDILCESWGWSENRLHDDTVCLIGWFRHLPAQISDVRRLLGLEGESEDMAGYLDYMATNYPDRHEQLWREQEGIWNLFYGCTACGDPLCGGVAGKIIMREEAVVWRFGGQEEPLDFRFHRPAYERTFLPLLEAMEAEAERLKQQADDAL